ncbi:MAG TPA: CocE/NonD family hydrolase, partial [Steroidobacteraceae bacterium]|nr:CocE/NonD family hydrolase [Steroidobacteraceae bacterium]
HAAPGEERGAGMRLARPWLWVCWLLLASRGAVAQDFDFRPPASVNDPATPGIMRDLADRMLPVYQEGNPERYLANLSAMQLVAGNYAAAYASRQSLRDRLKSGGRPVSRGFILDMYARARAVEANDRVTFAQAFAQVYRDMVPKLNDADAFTLTGWLNTPPASYQDAVQRVFDQRRQKGNIALADAIDLMQAYVSLEAYRSLGALVGPLIAEDERRRYETQDDVLIKTPDGTTLSALVVRPKTSTKPLPALLEYTLYLTPGYAREAAAHGYVGVVAYARGRGKSTGEALPYQYDGDDARAVISWIASQPWSDGRVGMYGSAYSGFVQWAAAKRLPPALKAIATTSPTVPGIDVPDDGGVFRNSVYRWSLYVTNVIDEKTYDDDTPWRDLDRKWYASGKRYRDLGSLYGQPNQLFLRWLNHPSYDRFWQSLVPYGREFAKVDIPVLTITGYYAAGEAGALYYFGEHHHYAPKANHTLLIGPYDDGVTQHGVLSTLRGYPLDQAAAIDLRELRYQWFDHVLKGAAVPPLLQGRVNYQVMGANEWRHAESLEAMGNGVLKWYLRGKTLSTGARTARTNKTARAGKGKPRGHKAEEPPEKQFVEQVVKLADRSDANGPWPGSDVMARSVPVRNAVTFTSEPLSKPLELQGAWSGKLDLTVNKMDVDLRVAGYELLPSGDYVALFEPYVFRASYAHDRVQRRLLRAGERQSLAFRLERLTSRKIQAGSRLILVIAVNKRPDQEINYGSGRDVSEEALEDDKTPVKIRWFGDSYIEMPVRR